MSITSPLALLTTNGTETSSLSPLAFWLQLSPTHCQFGPHPPGASRKTAASSFEKPELQRILRRHQRRPRLAGGRRRRDGQREDGDEGVTNEMGMERG